MQFKLLPSQSVALSLERKLKMVTIFIDWFLRALGI